MAPISSCGPVMFRRLVSTSVDKIDLGARRRRSGRRRRRSPAGDGRSRPAATGSSSGSGSGATGSRSRASASSSSCSSLAFVGAPISAHILGHGPNDIFADGVDPQTLAPVGPWTHISTAPYPGAQRALHDARCCSLGADGSLGRDLFLRLLYGAQTSLEVALLATIGSVGLGVHHGPASPATSAAGSTRSSRG